ncbi:MULTISPECIES: NAD-dependent epimerase/dehydratase family protein [Asticcacaulis]|uniref:NAD-dependent epimerase/dehydratase family protein n=1 Tax=Asticcacaulis TaxID=76890 RepID=UPI001AEB5FFB|nr:MULTISPECIES: NAD-dependent epimerase/dehydratase family protein [Asticcacaulis]MBP2161872.1 GDP-L-fucose synthase [Asticcacaulis solisilvae]MDR6802918.1 GDP-L-fucose synthase [Asticcacaulis sp. BE141]
MHILVTGATGFLGRHTTPALREAYPNAKVTAVSSKEYDLMSLDAARKMIAEVKPDVIVHYAAYSGGIGANRTYPADFYFRNTLLTANVFQAAAEAKVGKLIYTMGGCSYPATATSPIDESQLWNGYPQKESAGYSTAKMMGTVASKSYREQYGLNSVVLIPGNMYGEYDNFSHLDSHVVPAFVRRYYEAMRDGQDEVYMWGTGIAQRDFVYAADVARLVPWFIDNYDSSEPVNISAGTTTSIRELATTIAELVDYKGKIAWDDTKPDGQLVKIFSVERLKSLGLSCDTPLNEGLKKTIDWLAANYDAKSDGLRL